jgi:hypothetical protein
MQKYGLLAIVAAASLPVVAAPFRNLDFEEAQTTNIRFIDPTSGIGTTLDLLPGWQLYEGSTLQTNLYFNGNPIGSGFASLIDSRRKEQFVEGSYAVLFVATFGNTAPFSLVQRGDIPSDATLLVLRNQEYPFSLTLNGLEIPSAGSTGTSVPTAAPADWSYDVSRFAGQNVELRLTTFALNGVIFQDEHYLDSIRFVPEPPAGALFAVGTCGMAIALWRSRTRPRELNRGG